MHEAATFFHQLEWPSAGAHLAGPVVWLRGWVVGKEGFWFTDIRVVASTGIHAGVLGLPRTDLATHFKSAQSWLPAEYVVGVSLPEGPAEMSIEAMDEHGNWLQLQALSLTISPTGNPSPRIEGELVAHAGGSSTSRVPHLPFHGHLDLPESQPPLIYGQAEIFGWLLHETQTVHSVFAMTDGLAFNVIESGITDDSLAKKVGSHATARPARLHGTVDYPPTLTSPACLRVYAKLEDGSIHLCFAKRISPNQKPGATVAPPAKSISDQTQHSLPLLPSGRPRRLLMVARTLQPDDATLRALDVTRHLIGTSKWSLRLIVAEDGPLRDAFESSGCPVQIINPHAYFAATTASAVADALATLDRAIWWRHLDCVANFDPANTWVEALSRQHRIPVFVDPTDALLWFAPSASLVKNSEGDLLAPIRGQAAQGAGILLHAAGHLKRYHPKLFTSQTIILPEVRDTTEEELFKASLALQPQTALQIAVPSAAVAAMICPAFANHPHRTLLSALAAQVPLISTPSLFLSTHFTANEINFVQPGNPLSVAHAIADVLNNPSASARRTSAARRIVEQEYAPQRQLSRWQAWLESAIGR